MEKKDDPQMCEDANVLEVVKQLDQACRQTGFFYAVHLLFSPSLIDLSHFVVIVSHLFFEMDVLRNSFYKFFVHD